MLTQRDHAAVFEASPDAMLVVDVHGVIRDLNRQAIAMFGWSREEIEGSPVERLVPAVARSRHVGHRRHYGQAPHSRPMGRGLELQALHRDGTTIPVEISLSPSQLGPGRQHVICAIRDISGWKRMRRVSSMMIEAAENERKRLSRELHDDFLQSLVALKIRVKLLADEKDDEHRARARARIAAEIHDTIRRMKRVIRGLLPPELDRQGLSSALGSVFRDIKDVYGVTVHASLDRVSGQLDPVAALALYRIVQEALANAVRHARVEEATVTLSLTNELATATIRDEGCGFELPDPGELPGDGHIGLTGMRERAALVGGTVVVQTSPGEGTTVRATVPAAGPARETEGATANDGQGAPRR